MACPKVTALGHSDRRTGRLGDLLPVTAFVGADFLPVTA